MLETSLSFEDLQRELHARIYRFGLKLRFVFAPLPLLVGGFVFITDDSLWRRVIIAMTLGVVIGLSILYTLRDQQQRQYNVEPVIVAMGVVLHPMILFATGGIVSPVLIAMLMVCFVASTLLARRVSGFIVAAQITFLSIASTLEYLQPFGSLIPKSFRAVVTAGPSPALLLIYTSVAVLLFIVAREIGMRIQSAFADIFAGLAVARERSLQLYRDQLADLMLLSGEIAHELKNPLASVKGLAALLARRNQGEPSEPLVVLRREVDRMQQILEEFLNFSRPLVPLNLEAVNLHTIVHEVMAMHEGLSEMRRVSMELVGAADIEVHCDARKVRQILVNLIQNALEASTDSGHVLVRIASADATVTVTIEDDGVGVEPSVAARVFDAGVTTKPAGSGLGLNVARGLARQHRGDVTLSPRQPRGGVARLSLPLTAAVERRVSHQQPEGDVARGEQTQNERLETS